MSKASTSDKVIHEGKNAGTIILFGFIALLLLPAACGAISEVATNSAKESLKTPAGAVAAGAGGVYGAKRLKEFKDSRNGGGGGGGGGGAATGGGAGGAAAAKKATETPKETPPSETTTTRPSPPPTTAPTTPPPAQPRISREPLINLRPPSRDGLGPDLTPPQPQGQLQMDMPRIGAITQ